MTVAKDITGKTFGNLTVIRCVGSCCRGTAKKRLWECQCSCGKKKIVRTGDLGKNTRSCGCLKKQERPHLRLDLTNQVFGKLTALRQIGPDKRTGQTIWECRCSCGNITHVRSYDMRRGRKQSCGCSWTKGKPHDLTGQRFGKLTVIRPARTKNGLYGWICQCDCGAITEPRVGAALKRQGRQKSRLCSKCGSWPDLHPGQRFGRLVLIEQVKINDMIGVFYRCQCDCGNTTIVARPRLHRSATKSCGCLAREASSLRLMDKTIKKGQKFGRLTIIEEVLMREGGERKFLCECSCEQKTQRIVKLSNLKGGITRSCGCLIGLARKGKSGFRLTTAKIDLSASTINQLQRAEGE